MLVKLFARGVGAGKGPVEYCIATVVPAFDPETRRRIKGEFVTRNPAPVILRGDSARTTMLIDSSRNRWKYSSGVIPFEETDNPSAKELEAVMDSFEAMAFAGLEREQFDILWVKHTHEGNTELHFVSPRIELTTGKSLNLAPPGSTKTFDAWRDSWNYSKGWARPDDPARARLVRKDDHTIKADAARLKAGLAKNGDPKAAITAWLTDRIKAGLVTDRAAVVASLSELGEVTRQGKKYLSVKPEGFDKSVRLKGAIYEQSFQRAELGRDIGRETGTGQKCHRGIDQDRAGQARQDLKAAIQRRAQFNAERYRVRTKPAPERHQEANRTADQTPERYPDQRPEGSRDLAGSDLSGVAQAAVLEPEPLSGHLRRELGADSLAIGQHPGAAKDAGSSGAANRGAAEHDGQDRGQDVGRGILPGHKRAFSNFADRRFADYWLEHWQTACRQAWKKLRGVYDRTRETIGRWVEEIGRAVQAGHDAAGSAELAIATASADLGRASADLVYGTIRLKQQIERACVVLKINRQLNLSQVRQQSTVSPPQEGTEDVLSANEYQEFLRVRRLMVQKKKMEHLKTCAAGNLELMDALKHQKDEAQNTQREPIQQGQNPTALRPM